MTESELLLTELLNCDRAALYLNRHNQLNSEQSQFLSKVLKRRAQGEPLQYILGKTEFMGLEFRVNPAVLIPRQETEILVEAALNIVSRLAGDPASRLRILDLGAGSGCIAISLAKLLSSAQVDAVDISEEALAVACDNARRNNVQIGFFRGNLFSGYNLTPKTYHLIVSNPPYISSADIDQLQPEIKFEPRLALDGGNDGLDYYRSIVEQSPAYLADEGYLIMEMGYGQSPAIKNILQKSGKFEIIEVVKDYSDIERVLVAGIHKSQ